MIDTIWIKDKGELKKCDYYTVHLITFVFWGISYNNNTYTLPSSYYNTKDLIILNFKHKKKYGFIIHKILNKHK